MNEEEMTPDCQDFVILCYQLRRKLDGIKFSKYSPRVWAAVCSQKLVDICKECPDPEKSFNEIMGALDISFENQIGISDEDDWIDS